MFHERRERTQLWLTDKIIYNGTPCCTIYWKQSDNGERTKLFFSNVCSDMCILIQCLKLPSTIGPPNCLHWLAATAAAALSSISHCGLSSLNQRCNQALNLGSSPCKAGALPQSCASCSIDPPPPDLRKKPRIALCSCWFLDQRNNPLHWSLQILGI